MAKPTLISGLDGLKRCGWCVGHADYLAYHDVEWGRPVVDDAPLFEKLCLEGFQSGLSWLTILRKRENFRRAFREFEIDRVVRFNERSVGRLLKDAGIVRHEGKIRSAINNASRARELRDEFGSLGAFFWRYRVDGAFSGLPATTETSTALAKELKRRGWSFVGPTTAYAFMQAMGLVNDHLPGCSLRAEVEVSRTKVRLP
ncbi:MAG: DNA-3-methyladenine glycosylase I [Planctomycetes bacterium]|nr:DNA-3-methyladenine glycosylase I [Planctomycetota bacterium]